MAEGSGGLIGGGGGSGSGGTSTKDNDSPTRFLFTPTHSLALLLSLSCSIALSLSLLCLILSSSTSLYKYFFLSLFLQTFRSVHLLQTFTLLLVNVTYKLHLNVNHTYIIHPLWSKVNFFHIFPSKSSVHHSTSFHPFRFGFVCIVCFSTPFFNSWKFRFLINQSISCFCSQ